MILDDENAGFLPRPGLLFRDFDFLESAHQRCMVRRLTLRLRETFVCDIPPKIMPTARLRISLEYSLTTLDEVIDRIS